MNHKKSVIIGAGQTGRGFIAPFLQKAGYQITFLDCKDDVIKNLNSVNSYKVSYFGDEKESIEIKDYKAFQVENEKAVLAIREADYIFTAVGESNVGKLIPLLKKALDTSMVPQKKRLLMTCENGISPKRVLVNQGLDKKIDITEGIVFCTTIHQADMGLDLLSEEYPCIPYDCEATRVNIPIAGFQPTVKFHTLIERKIFTYNCLSAVVSYIGAYKGFEDYGAAANDETILIIIEKLADLLNEALASFYGIALEEQQKFCDLAIKKFQNRDILDSISRNARDVKRKLGSKERLISPLRIILKYEKNPEVLNIVIAAAMHYGIMRKELDESPQKILTEICQLNDVPDVREEIIRIYHLLEKDIDLKKLVKAEVETCI